MSCVIWNRSCGRTLAALAAGALAAGGRSASEGPRRESATAAAAVAALNPPGRAAIPAATPGFSAKAKGAATRPARLGPIADKRIHAAEALIQQHPDRPRGYADLAAAFMGKGRETADATYYARADAACRKALQIDPTCYDALRLVAWIYNTRHRYREAKEAAAVAMKANPDDAWNLGMLGDALAELGEYEAAEDAYDAMMNVRPDLAAYARQSYMGELHGDTDFALESMRTALRAADPEDAELVAWCRVRLGDVLFNAGRVRDAGAEYGRALDALPDYYAALAGAARARAAEGQADEAVRLYQRSVRVAPTEPAIAALIDLLVSLGRTGEAARQFAVVEAIRKIAAASGVRPGASMALLDADHGRDPAGALRIAEACAAEQQDVRTLDALAWVRFKNGQYAEAREAMNRAMRLGTRDALMYFHQGMIEAKLGDRAAAVAALRKAIEINPHFNPRHGPAAREMLRTLEGGAPATEAAR